jgi:hypothetical protein
MPKGPAGTAMAAPQDQVQPVGYYPYGWYYPMYGYGYAPMMPTYGMGYYYQQPAK